MHLSPFSAKIREAVTANPEISDAELARLLNESTITQHTSFSTTIACNKCERENIPLDSAVFLDGCSHVVCRDCITGYLADDIQQQTINSEFDVMCPVSNCQSTIALDAIKAVLSHEEYTVFTDKLFERLIAQRSDLFVRCPNTNCNCVIERTTIATNSTQQQPRDREEPREPSAISRLLARLRRPIASLRQAPQNASPESVSEVERCHQQNRYRCASCSSDFCAECKESPYHKNYTCQQWKDYKNAKRCRFCGAVINSVQLQQGNQTDVCSASECINRYSESCKASLSCGHPCYGIHGETNCPPCLSLECATHSNLSQNCDEFCNICWTETLGQAPVIQLEKCGHIFHSHCVINKLKNRWPGPNITFSFMNCPLCNEQISHCSLNNLIEPLTSLRSDITRKAMLRLTHEKLDNDDAIIGDSSGRFYNKPEAYALSIFAYYQCYRCKRPYYGGRIQCEAQEERQFDPSELICASCSSLDPTSCPKHGSEFIEYKCRFCCQLAVWFCWGKAHFCEQCHQRQVQGDYVSHKERSQLPVCKGPVECPSGGNHPPNGEEYIIGCSLCRGEQDF